MDSDSGRNNQASQTCCGQPSHCFMHTFAVFFTTIIFMASMILTVVMTFYKHPELAVLVLAVSSCILYISGFISNMSTLCSRPISIPPEISAQNSHRSSQSTQNSSSHGRTFPDLISFARGRVLPRNTPSPPNDIEMSEISRMQPPGTSLAPESSTQNSEITDEARKLVLKLYGEIKRMEQMVPKSSGNDKSEKQVVQTPRTPVKQHEKMSQKVSHKTPVVKKKQTDVERIPSLGLPPVDFRTNQSIHQKTTPNSFSTQLDSALLDILSERCSSAQSQRSLVNFRSNHSIEQKAAQNSPELMRLVRMSEGCDTSSVQKSPSISSRPLVDLHSNQPIKQKVAQNSFEMTRFIRGSEGCTTDSPQLSPRRECSKIAQKRNLSISKSKVNVSRLAADGTDFQSNEYEEIDVVRSNQGASSPLTVECYSTESEFGDQASSVSSAVSEPGSAERRRKFPTPDVKVRRLLSPPSSRKFCQLGKSPETVLDAIATCFDLTPDEWMHAWNLSLQGVSLNEKAKILGVRLHEDSYSDDNSSLVQTF